jgi:hypothetical protein
MSSSLEFFVEHICFHQKHIERMSVLNFSFIDFLKRSLPTPVAEMCKWVARHRCRLSEYRRFYQRHVLLVFLFCIYESSVAFRLMLRLGLFVLSI